MVTSRWIAGAGLALLAAGTAGAGTPTFPASAAGDWVGTVRARDAQRHLFLHIHTTHTGVVAILNSPEGPPGGAVVRPLAADDGVLAFAADGGRFQGRWNTTDGRWEGTWTEAGVSAPLTLSLNDDGAMRTRLGPAPASPVIETPPLDIRGRSDPAEIVPPPAR
jgi:hypothetical protein